MGDPTCEHTEPKAVESSSDSISYVDIDIARFCKVTTLVKNEEVMTAAADDHDNLEARGAPNEESIESSAGTETLTDASLGEVDECFPENNLLGAVNAKPVGGFDAGSSIPSDSLHSFFSLLFDENASKMDELDDGDEWSVKEEGNQPFEKAKSIHAQQHLVEKEPGTTFDQTQDLLYQNSHTLLNSNHENSQREKKQSEHEASRLDQMKGDHMPNVNGRTFLDSHAEYPQRKRPEARGKGRALLSRGDSDSRLLSGVSNVKQKLQNKVEVKHPETSRMDHEKLALSLLMSQSSLELCDVFDSPLKSVEQPEALDSSGGDKVQQDSSPGANSQDEGRTMSSIQEQQQKTSRKWYSSAAEANKKGNSFHGGFFQPNKQNKCAMIQQPSLDSKASSCHGQSFGSKLARHASITSFFSHDRRRLSRSKSYQAKDILNDSAKLDDRKETDASTAHESAPSIAFEMDDTDRVSNSLVKKETARAEAISHRRDELIDSIRQSLHKEDGLQNLRGPFPKASKRQDKTKEDVLASSNHSQASYFKAPRRVTAAAESICKLAKVGASKAKETAKAGAMLASKATVSATKTARATVMAPAYAASYVVNMKGKGQSSDPPADESNVEPTPYNSVQHSEPNRERHKVSESRIEDARDRKSNPHRQRSGSGDSTSRRRSSSHHRTSVEGRTQAKPSRQSIDSERPRLRSRSTASTRHRSNEDKSSARLSSVRRDREGSLENRQFNRESNGESKGTASNVPRSQLNRRQHDDDKPSRPREPSRGRNSEENAHSSTKIRSSSNRGSDEKSISSRSQSRGRNHERNSVSQHRSRSRRRADDTGTIASSRSRTSRSVSRRRLADIDESTHRSRRRGRSLRRSDPPGLAADYENEDKPAKTEPQVREYRGRSKSHSPRRKRRNDNGGLST